MHVGSVLTISHSLRVGFDSLSLQTTWDSIKVELSLCLTKYHAMKMYGRVEV
jgi:hypothetical protein